MGDTALAAPFTRSASARAARISSPGVSAGAASPGCPDWGRVCGHRDVPELAGLSWWLSEEEEEENTAVQSRCYLVASHPAAGR